MSKDKQKAVMALTEQPVHKKGYTLDQLRYKLALTDLQKDFCKEKMINQCHSVMSNTPWNKKSGSGFGGSLIGGILKGLSYTDYVVMGLSVFKTAKNVFSFFKSKKR